MAVPTPTHQITPPQPPPQPPQIQQQQFNEEKEHYKSLRTLFITAMSIFTTFIGAVLGIFLWSTFQSRKDMKDELDGARKEMQAAVKEMKDEVKERGQEFSQRESQWSSDITTLMTASRGEVRELRTDAANEISGIRGIAIGEAKGRIDEVFRQTNLQEFIAAVAKDRMGAYVRQYVNERYEGLEKQKVDSLIKDLEGPIMMKQLMAASELLTKPSMKFEEHHINTIIKMLRSGKVSLSQKPTFYAILAYRQSETISTFFKQELISNPNDQMLLSYGLPNLVGRNNESDIEFYIDLVNTASEEYVFVNLIQCCKNYNLKLLWTLLNSEKIVSILLKKLNPDQYRNMLGNVESNLVSDIPTEKLNETVLFSKAPIK